MELLLIPILFLLDQWTKKRAENGEFYGKYLMNQKVKLGLVFNEGAFLGLFKKSKVLLYGFSFISLCILVAIAVPIFMTKGLHLMKLGIGLLGGGSAGNLYDRFKKGRVTDFFSFSFRPKLYFNLADMFIFLGAFLLAIGSLFSDSE